MILSSFKPGFQTTMRFESRIFQLAKDPQAPTDFQDACQVDAAQGVATVADGVSSSLFAGVWASILTAAVVADPPDPADPNAFGRWLANRRAAWSQQIDASNLPWFQKVKLKQGAFSTLLWIRLNPSGSEYGMQCWAVGDCCLFHVRGERLLRSFPILNSAELDANPLALGSLDLNHDQYLRFATFDDGCSPGDTLVLCTDALAGWALKEYESGRTPAWDRLWSLSEDAWRAEIIEQRAAQQIRYDDTTLLLLRVCHPPTTSLASKTVPKPVPAVVIEPIVPTSPASSPKTVPKPVSAVVVEPIVPTSPASSPKAVPKPVPAVVVEPIVPPLPPPNPPAGLSDSDVRRWAESIASASEDLAEQVSDEMIKGMRKLKDSLFQKYRDNSAPKDPKKGE